MQEWKTIKEVPTEVLAESLLAIQDLRRKYLVQERITQYTGAGFTDSCPLCHFDSVFTKDVDIELEHCICPWYWFHGHGCCYEGSKYYEQTIEERLTRIDRWEDATVEELALRRITQAGGSI